MQCTPHNSPGHPAIDTRRRPYRCQTAAAEAAVQATLVVQGMLNKQIAAALKVSEITVKVRRRSLMDKLGAKALADLVRLHDQVRPPSA